MPKPVTSAKRPATYFTFTNGGTGDGGTVAPTGSWWTFLAIDTDSDYMPDANCYTSMRGTIASAPDNDAYTAPAGFGYLHFGILNTITTGSGGMSQNTGNMVTRDWNFFGALGSEFTTSPLTVDAGCSQTSTSCTVNMSG